MKPNAPYRFSTTPSNCICSCFHCSGLRPEALARSTSAPPLPRWRLRPDKALPLTRFLSDALPQRNRYKWGALQRRFLTGTVTSGARYKGASSQEPLQVGRVTKALPHRNRYKLRRFLRGSVTSWARYGCSPQRALPQRNRYKLRRFLRGTVASGARYKGASSEEALQVGRVTAAVRQDRNRRRWR